MTDQNRERPKEDIHPVMDPPQPAGLDEDELDEADRNNAAEDETRRNPARPDPRTGEVPAGPGDAGLEDRPALNQGSPGTKQMSNSRLGKVLGIALLLAIVMALVASVF